MGPFSIECFSCSNSDWDGGGGGEENEAAGRAGEGLARGACRGYPLVIIKGNIAVQHGNL